MEIYKLKVYGFYRYSKDEVKEMMWKLMSTKDLSQENLDKLGSLIADGLMKEGEGEPGFIGASASFEGE